MSKRRGFTLVELLVVIGIIAMLIGILLPALSRARKSVRDVKCLANLHSLGQAFAAYAANNKNWWPAPAAPNQNPPGWSGTPATVGIFWHRDYIFPLIVGRPATAAETVGNTFIKGSVFECPAAQEQPPGLSATATTVIDPNDQQNWGYGMSARLNDIFTPAGAALQDAAYNGVKNTPKNVAKVHNPQLTCLLIDNAGAWAGTINDNSGAGVTPVTTDAMWVRLRAAVNRHTNGPLLTGQLDGTTINTAASRAEKGTLNVLYADYHAAPVNYFDIPKATAATGANADRRWYQFWCGTNSASANSGT